MSTQRAAEVQAALEGVPLPATRSTLLAYARGQAPDIVTDLETLPEREFDRLDEVGEALAPVSRAGGPVGARLPRPESDEPPGGDDYVNAFSDDTGSVRHDAPPDNPPQKAIERASELQKKQAASQGS